jgi:cytochrome c oxidase subunit 2
MIGLVATLIVILLAVIVVQIGKVSELAGKIRGEEIADQQANNRQAVWLVLFMVVMLVVSIVSAYYYKNYMLGYGPLQSASEHGSKIDGLFNVTLFFTGIVFVVTQVLLFWYSYKYRSMPNRKAKFISHNNTVELIWTAVPALVMTFLVAQGLSVWNDVMPDVNPEDEYLEIEATGYQFAWDIRYPGNDNRLGTKNYKLIQQGRNDLGLDFTDTKTHDDIILSGSDRIVLPVDTTVRVRITAKDVLHNFYLPHFRVKMDAIPGLPTYFIFKPVKTTEEFRQELRKYPEYNVPYDPTDPESKMKWEEFNFELACAELCGKGHYSMKRIVEIVSREEYEEWLAGKTPFYPSVRGTEVDPLKGERLLGFEIEQRKQELSSDFMSAIAPDATDESRTIQLKNVFYNTGSAALDDLSRYELDYLASLMKDKPSVQVVLGGHTDNTGDDAANLALSESRASNVANYLLQKGIGGDRIVAKGFGELSPLDTNETDEGRANNRRTELTVVSI